MSSKKNFFGVNRAPNTFIGARGNTITTPALLAAKLSIVSGNIHNFSIDANNNISCYIGRDYSINANAFASDSVITYYIDIDGKCTTLNSQAFSNAFNPITRKILLLPNLTTSGYRAFSGGGAGTKNKWGIIALPLLEPLGALATTSEDTFSWADFFYNVYINSANQTNNGGGVEQDLVPAGTINTGLVSSNVLTWIKYSTNNNRPTPVTGLNIIDVTADSIELGWTALTHSNSIDYYVVFMDGVFQGSPSTTSLLISGLTTATSYEFKILGIDNMGNISTNFSNIFTVTTL